MDDIVNNACNEETFCDEVVSSSTPDTSLCSPAQQSLVSVSSYSYQHNSWLAIQYLYFSYAGYRRWMYDSVYQAITTVATYNVYDIPLAIDIMIAIVAILKLQQKKKPNKPTSTSAE